ncbi:MAG: hypothetical protein EBU66_10345 [Bacteroidetes bacterium]|nr:hypothetical protein [bacterium]NBP65040.1 hypothetical protein [Bacteroidota bacterium]
MAQRLPPKKFKQIDEALVWANEASSTEELVERIRAISLGNSILMRFLAWGVGYEQGPVNLPEGSTPYKDEGLPSNMADTTITQEFRRILTLLPEGSAKNLPQWRREEIWMQICQGVHKKEADLLDVIKDQRLLEIYPTFTVLENFLPGWKAPEVKKKKSPKKSSATL